MVRAAGSSHMRELTLFGNGRSQSYGWFRKEIAHTMLQEETALSRHAIAENGGAQDTKHQGE